MSAPSKYYYKRKNLQYENSISSFEQFFWNKLQRLHTADVNQVAIKSYSQPDVLQQKMREKKLTHGETVIATLSPVRLEKEFGKLVLYFCPMENIEVLETISPGDGGHIPCDVSAEGLAIPRKHKTGLYRLKNVTLTSNGMMEIKATEKTEWEKLEP